MPLFGEPNIEKLRARNDVKSLTKALRYDVGLVRRRAADALREIGDSRAVAPLTETLRDPDPDVRHSAAAALAEIADVRAVEPLADALADLSQGRPEYVARALDRFGWSPRNDTGKALYLIANGKWEELPGLGESAVESLIGVLVAASACPLSRVGGTREDR